MNKKEIDEQIELRTALIKIRLSVKLAHGGSYKDLSETEKIPFRVMQAELEALKELKIGTDLNKWLDDCVEKEYYCGAEGIKRILELENFDSNLATEPEKIR